MFESLSDRLGGIFDKITGRGALSEADVNDAMREIRRALLEADVALDVVRSFTDKVRNRAVGAEVIRAVKPGQMVVKIVHDQLVEMLGEETVPVSLQAAAPVPLMMVGLQGSGKTTTTAKLAKRLTERQKKKVLMASLDTRRPAAQEQLRILGEQVGVATLPIVAGQGPVEIANRAMTAARLGGYDVVMLDTAGRTHIDEPLMIEMQEIKAATRPHEILLVADSLTGQDAVNVARSFDERVGVSGIVLTRVDGDGRGGAALSMRTVTGKPIKLIGTGEKMDALEDFHPGRIADRILGMGDIVSLVERAAENIDAEQAKAAAAKLKKGEFDLEDLAGQLKQMQKIGGMSGILGMMPGIGKVKKQLDAAGIDDRIVKRQLAIISSMTREERRKPALMNASRKKRVASGCGLDVQDVNKLLKMHRQMSDMMKKIGKTKGGLAGLFGGGGMPQPDPAMLEEMAKGGGLGNMGGGLPGGLGGLGGLGGGGLPPGLPRGLGGLGGGFPGMPGFGKGPKKK
ncbi:signal recognition particle subunit FFH/SRP54 (srp54) [Faunimonas pinastri]|uniref:Signal recognition particle protein n=1 Tax=Faunimonas pinastri TaxID=1855383 RepID=A0A1H9MDP6_9HYPH|nr:signal recognition particle protein [Faunimonas pinastri]SER21567.1 signal recognition particle subunit FFH/SRP54 (srp54) [Faunimonas pinastri]